MLDFSLPWMDGKLLGLQWQLRDSIQHCSVFLVKILNESDKAGAGDKAGTMDIDLPPTDGFGTTLGDYGMFTCVLARLHCTNDQALRRCCCNLFLYCFTS